MTLTEDKEKFTDQLKSNFIELRAKGKPYSEIAEELGIDKELVFQWAKENETEIKNSIALELEKLGGKYFVSKQKRIELIGGYIDKMKTELDKRDLSKVSTDKLFSLLADYTEILKKEYPNFELQVTDNIYDSGFTTYKKIMV